MEHITHAATISDKMYFSNPRVPALSFDKMSDGAADTTLAEFNNMHYGKGRERLPGAEERALNRV
jgi:hypothetical protein